MVESGAAPKSEEGEPIFAVTVPNAASLPPGTKRMVIMQERLGNIQLATGMRPEIANWVGEQLIAAAKVAASPITIASAMPRTDGRPSG